MLRETPYNLALVFVRHADQALKSGFRIYRTKEGVLLTALDEIVRAFLQDNLIIEGDNNESRSIQ